MKIRLASPVLMPDSIVDGEGIRAVLCNMPESAYLGRFHNNANVLVVSGGYKGYPKLSKHKLVKILKTFLTTPFEGDRHIQRIKDLDEMY